jgi:hypothetical protein
MFDRTEDRRIIFPGRWWQHLFERVVDYGDDEIPTVAANFARMSTFADSYLPADTDTTEFLAPNEDGEPVVFEALPPGGRIMVPLRPREADVASVQLVPAAQEEVDSYYGSGFSAVLRFGDVTVPGNYRRSRAHGSCSASTPRPGAHDRAYLAHCGKVMGRLAARMRKSLEGREAITALGQEIYELLPTDLQERWAHLTPDEFTLLAMVFPEQLPANARALLGE